MTGCKGCEEKMADITILNKQMDDKEEFIQKQNEVLQLKQKMIIAKQDIIDGTKKEISIMQKVADVQKNMIRQMRKDRWLFILAGIVIGAGIDNLVNFIIGLF